MDRRIIRDIKKILVLAKAAHGHLEKNRIGKARKELKRIIKFDLDELARIQQEHGDEKLLEECTIVFKDAKQALRDLDSEKLFYKAEKLIDEIVNLEGHQLLNVSHEDQIENYLYRWWHEEIYKGWAYHGSGIIYEDFIRKNGLDPKKRPFSGKIKRFFRIVQKVRPISGVLSEYLSWNLKDSRLHVDLELVEKTFWTTNYSWIKTDFGLGGKRGGEYMKGIQTTAENIIEAYNEKEEVRTVISKNEFEFVESVLEWAKNIRYQKKTLVLKLRLSNPAFSESWITEHKPIFGGSYDNFKSKLKHFFVRKKMAWTFQAINKFLSGGPKPAYQIIVKEKVKAKDIIFEKTNVENDKIVEYREDRKKLRLIKLAWEENINSRVVYHGTSSACLDKIKRYGLVPGMKIYSLNELNTLVKLMSNAGSLAPIGHWFGKQGGKIYYSVKKEDAEDYARRSPEFWSQLANPVFGAEKYSLSYDDVFRTICAKLVGSTTRLEKIPQNQLINYIKDKSPLSNKEINLALRIFYRLWETFGKARPVVLHISLKAIDDGFSNFLLRFYAYLKIIQKFPDDRLNYFLIPSDDIKEKVNQYFIYRLSSDLTERDVFTTQKISAKYIVKYERI